jgi:hypothetical protein
MSRVVYRIVVNNPPSDDDLRSYADLGHTVSRPKPELERLMTGISVMGTMEAAIKKAKGRPWLSDAWIAEIVIPNDSALVIEKTTRDPNHYTVWAAVEELRGLVGRVVRVPKD